MSLKAKGLLSFLLSLPPNFMLYKSSLHELLAEGRNGVRETFNELVALGYVKEKKVSSTRYEYIIGDEPIPENPLEISTSENQTSENQTYENGISEIRASEIGTSNNNTVHNTNNVHNTKNNKKKKKEGTKKKSPPPLKDISLEKGWETGRDELTAQMKPFEVK